MCLFGIRDLPRESNERRTLRYKHMEGACWGKEDASGSGARLLQWSQLSVPAVPVVALTTDITLTRRAHAEKGAWQLRLFTPQSCYACTLQCLQAPPGETLDASQENSSVKQWQNLSFSTISHILFFMLESLEPRGNVFVSCLVWGMWCAVSVTLQSAQYFWCALATDTRVLFFFFHHKHRTSLGWRVRRQRN